MTVLCRLQFGLREIFHRPATNAIHDTGAIGPLALNQISEPFKQTHSRDAHRRTDQHSITDYRCDLICRQS
jgi:hypothetical protein